MKRIISSLFFTCLFIVSVCAQNNNIEFKPTQTQKTTQKTKTTQTKTQPQEIITSPYKDDEGREYRSYNIHMGFTKYNFGQFNEDQGKVTVAFPFQNLTNSPIYVLNVVASCGCISYQWDKKPIGPGQTGEIYITYNATGRPGSFSKGITATIGIDQERSESISLRVEGDVTKPRSGDKSAFTVKGITFNMIYVEGGTFTMGATPEQGNDVESDEKPIHEVTLNSFFIGETEVTQALWEAVMGRNPSYWRNYNNPVDGVSLFDCLSFVNKLNQMLSSQLNGKSFRLLTEAEWEYAARGGNKSRGYKYSGSNNLNDVAWYDNNSAIAGGTKSTHIVKSKQPNELGIYDMSGNVMEWCSDIYNKNYYSTSPSANPKGASNGSRYVYRGGCVRDDANDNRISRRERTTADNRSSILGFRIALSK